MLRYRIAPSGGGVTLSRESIVARHRENRANALLGTATPSATSEDRSHARTRDENSRESRLTVSERRRCAVGPRRRLDPAATSRRSKRETQVVRIGGNFRLRRESALADGRDTTWNRCSTTCRAPRRVKARPSQWESSSASGPSKTTVLRRGRRPTANRLDRRNGSLPRRATWARGQSHDGESMSGS